MSSTIRHPASAGRPSRCLPRRWAPTWLFTGCPHAAAPWLLRSQGSGQGVASKPRESVQGTHGASGPRSRFLSHLRRFIFSSISPRHPSDVTTFFVLACVLTGLVLTGLGTELRPSASPTRRVSLSPSCHDTPASLRLQICRPEPFPKTILPPGISWVFYLKFVDGI